MPDSTLTYRTRNGKITNATGLNVVFLSYRKQNKVFRNDVVRDILDANDCAVWCDRHLSAGEDFNEEIAAALERMNVFVLMVTPATFEPGCYTLTKEIPRALERKIPIIPILLEETDMKRFAEVLGDIHALDKREPDEYEDELRDRLGKILPTKDEKEKIRMAQKESGSRAAKTIYYQGLGWLTGENCERDPDRGVQMITAAAISGEAPEALLRLAGLYETGDGVTRDWQQALEWYDRYTAAMESRFGENEDDDVSLAKAYDSKGKLLKNHGKLTAAKAAFVSYQQVCERMMTLYDGKQERELSISYNRLGDVCMADGDLTGAKEYYLKALAISDRLAAYAEGTQAQRDLSISYNKLGDVCMADGDLTGAKEYYLKALAIRERLAADAEGTQAQDDIAVSYYKLGTLDDSDMEERMMYLQKANDIWTDLATATGIAEYHRRRDIVQNIMQSVRQAQSAKPETPTPETPVEQPKKTHLVGKIIGGLLAAGIVALIALQLTGVIDVTEWFAELPGLFR